MRKFISSLCLIMACAVTASAQSVTPSILNTTGGTNFFTFYRFEWSFGEAVAVETLTAPTVTVTNGVLQPVTHNPATTSSTPGWDKDEIILLPNPVRNMLEIDFFSKKKGRVTINLIDANGRLLGNRQFEYYGTGRIEKWNMEPYPAGVYFFNIMIQSNANATISKKGAFKVVKIK